MECQVACLLSKRSQFWAHVTAYKLQNSLEMRNFVTSGAAKGGPGGMRGDG